MTGRNPSPTSMTKYTKVLPVSVRKDAGVFHGNGENNVSPNQGSLHQATGEQREYIRFTLLYPSPSYGAMNPNKEIALRLTNDENPLFYYHLRVTEAEFPNLRLQQGLLVDFSDFPGQLESLLDKCGTQTISRVGGDELMGTKPKFILVLKITERNTVLDIVESNPFKYLCHLSLQVNQGSDAEVKKFLGDVTSTLKNDLSLLQEKYNHLASSMEAELARLNALHENKCVELNQLREEVYSQTSNMTTRHFHELTEEKEKLLKLQSELVSKFDQERMEMDKQNKQAQKALQSRISNLESENQNLTVVKANQESALQDATSRLRACGEELKSLQQELASVRQQNSQLDYDYHQIRAAKGECQREIQSLEKTVKKNEETIQKQRDTIIALSCEKKQLEEQKQSLTKDLDKIRSSSKVTASELAKAHEIIKKLQDDIRASHAKCKLQTTSLAENENVIGSLEKRLRDLEEELKELSTSLHSTNSELHDTKAELQASKERITEFENTVQSNENMISYLNKQLNELQVLTELNKFRANLSQFDPASKQTDPKGAAAAPNNPKNARPVPRISQNRALVNSESNPNNNNNNSTQPLPASTNSTQGASPSWLHIYQSTNNNNNNTDHDLSSRLEHVSALGSILSQAQSRTLPSRSAKEDHYPPQTTTSPGEDDDSSKPKSNLNSSKPPTWAKSKSKVTLDNMLNKPTFPIWKNK